MFILWRCFPHQGRVGGNSTLFRAALPTQIHCVHPPKRWGYSNGCSGNKLLENHVCKRSGDAKTCFVDFRVETFNFADLAPTVQSRRVRDKKECFRFHLVQLLWWCQHLQTCLARGLSFGVSAIFSDGYNFYIYVYMYFMVCIYTYIHVSSKETFALWWFQFRSHLDERRAFNGLSSIDNFFP